MKLLINETTIAAAARDYSNEWRPLIEAGENTFEFDLCQSIVDWVESIDGDYCARFDFVKSLFPNFYY